MIFSEKLQLLRKSKGFTQEEFAEKFDVSRQAVAKWEAGQSYPDIANLIQISNLLNVTVDYLVKEQECAVKPVSTERSDVDEIIAFRLEANVNTYAAMMNETASTRLDSHDFRYERGEFVYHDTYVGGEQFAGEEAIPYNDEGVSHFSARLFPIIYSIGSAGLFFHQTFDYDIYFRSFERISIIDFFYCLKF